MYYYCYCYYYDDDYYYYLKLPRKPVLVEYRSILYKWTICEDLCNKITSVQDQMSHDTHPEALTCHFYG